MLCEKSDVFKRQFHAEFERLVCLDYVIRNTDRTEDNWMVRVVWVRESDQIVYDGLVPTDQEKIDSSLLTPLVKIAAIDNGLAFPWKHPTGLRQFPFSWQYLNQSLIPFSSTLRHSLLSILSDPNKWDELSLHFAAIMTSYDPSSITFLPRQLSILRGQLWNLKCCLEMKGSTPMDLLAMPKLRVEDDGEHFWKRYGWRKDKAGFNEHSNMGRRWWVRTEPDANCCSCFY
jgi:phosphatidylinositol 4-kinase type 2